MFKNVKLLHYPYVNLASPVILFTFEIQLLFLTKNLYHVFFKKIN